MNNTCLIMSTKNLIDKYKDKLQIPELQREYVWETSQLQMLWDDIIACFENSDGEDDTLPQHFMGFITFKKWEDEDKYDVLDGQQRLSTFCILLDCIQAKMGISLGKRLRLNLKSDSILLADEESKEISKNAKENRTKVFCFFIDKIQSYFEINFFDDENNRKSYIQKLYKVVADRFFWCICLAEESPYNVFEGLNATGKNIEFSDFLMSYILELNEQQGEKKYTNEEIKEKWNRVLASISKSRLIPEENADIGESDGTEGTANEAFSDDSFKPLKFKKFLNALHSVTLISSESMPETVSAFAKVFVRLHNSYDTDDENEMWTDANITAEYIISSLEKWGNIYAYIVDPAGNELSEIYKYDENSAGIKETEEEIYLLSLIATAKTLPMMMRTIYGLSEKRYSEAFVKTLFGTVARVMIYTEIYSHRLNADKKAAFDKIPFADRFAESVMSQQTDENSCKFACAYLMGFLAGDKFYMDMKGKFKFISEEEKEKELKKSVMQTIMQYPYNSRYSKAVLLIDHDFNEQEGKTILELERSKKNKSRSYFEVEHMVAQNIDGNASDYGFSIADTAAFKNLILLEGYLNSSVSNKEPSEKKAEWGKSALSAYYKTYASGFNFDNSKADFASCQNERMEKLTDAFFSYMQEAFPKISKEEDLENIKNLTGNFTPWFLYEKKDKGKVVFTKNYSENYSFDIACNEKGWRLFSDYENGIKEPCNDDVIYSAIYEGDEKICNKIDYQILPEPITKKAADITSLFIKGNEQKDNISIFSLIESFLKLWIDEKGEESVIKFLKSTENKEGNYSVKNSYRIIHTVRIRKWADDEDKKSPSNKQYNFLSSQNHRKKTFIYGNNRLEPVDFGTKYNDDTIEINTSYSFDEAARLLKTIFSLADEYYEKQGNNSLKFSLFIKSEKPRFQYFLDNSDGVVITPYMNIGEEASFRKHVNSVLHLLEDNKLKLPESSTLKSCFNIDTKCYDDILKKYSPWTIPEYQRKYVWGKKEWEVLFKELAEDNISHLGSIIFYDKNPGYNLADGQQRLTTLKMFKKALKGEEDKTDAVYTDLLNWMKTKKNTVILNEKIDKCCFNVLIIKDAPSLYQYQVFTAVNGKGKKLTCEEKFKNFILSKGGDAKSCENIIKSEGFLKVFAEINKKRHISDEELYDVLKEICSEKNSIKETLEEMQALCSSHNMLTGKKPCRNFKDSSNIMWLQLYRVLSQVNTADALLTDVLYRLKNNSQNMTEEKAAAVFKKIDLIYFLLYVMDRSRNDKKSINAKLPCLIEKDENIFVNCPINDGSSILSQTEINSLTKGKEAEDIWKNYVETADIGAFKKTTSRFILYFIEYWLGNTDLGKIIEGESSGNIPELEHIFPLSQENENITNIKRPAFVNRLQNVCLLEKSINSSVGNSCLIKDPNKKSAKCKLLPAANGDKKYYGESKFIMPKMFYDENNKPRFTKISDNVGYYSEDMAEMRIEEIRDRVMEAFKEDMKLIFKEKKTI